MSSVLGCSVCEAGLDTGTGPLCLAGWEWGQGRGGGGKA